jgi:hypothetical protein
MRILWSPAEMTEKPPEWPRNLTRAEKHLRRAAEYAELGKKDRALGELTKAQACIWNSQYDLMKNNPKYFVEAE